MSDHIVKIIPIDPYFYITDKQAQRALQFLKQNIKADLVKMRIQKSPAFWIAPKKLDKNSKEKLCKATKSNLGRFCYAAFKR